MSGWAPGKVSVVVINWNEGAYIGECLDCLAKQEYRNIETTVVDQGSTDGSTRYLETEFGRHNIIYNQTNVGYAHGMNQGIGVSTGEYVLMLSADVFLDRSFIGEVVSLLQRPDTALVGIIAPKVYKFAGGQRSQEIDGAGVFLLSRLAITLSRNSRKEEYVFGPAGACPVVRRSMLEDIRLPSGDYYDSSYFAFYEDVDLWLRAQIRGWKCVFTPKAIAWHIHGGSTGGKVRFYERPLWLQYHWRKNRLTTLLQDIPTALFRHVLPGFLLAEIGLWAVILTHRPGLLLPSLRAYRYVFQSRSEILQKRNYVLGRRIATNEYLKSLFVGL